MGCIKGVFGLNGLFVGVMVGVLLLCGGFSWIFGWFRIFCFFCVLVMIMFLLFFLFLVVLFECVFFVGFLFGLLLLFISGGFFGYFVGFGVFVFVLLFVIIGVFGNVFLLIVFFEVGVFGFERMFLIFLCIVDLVNVFLWVEIILFVRVVIGGVVGWRCCWLGCLKNFVGFVKREVLLGLFISLYGI